MPRTDLVVIVGTDTGVGKTHVAARVASTLSTTRRVVAIKPVESGCPPESGDEDGVLLARATGQDVPRAALVRLRAPLAPPVAADAEGVALAPERWLDTIEELARGAELTIVEGAGGLLSPLTWTVTALDVARQLDARALVVAANQLGALNHVRLTLSVLRAAAIDIVGVVLNAAAPLDEAAVSNAAALRRCEPLAPVTTWDRGDDARAAATVAGWLTA